MRYHLLSKQDGPIILAHETPEFTDLNILPAADHQWASWNGNMIVLQNKQTPEHGISFLSIVTEKRDQIITAIPDGIIAFYLALSGSMLHQVTGINRDLTFYERSYNIVIAESLFVTTTVDAGRHEILFITVTRNYLDGLAKEVSAIASLVTPLLNGGIGTVVRVNQIADHRMLQLVAQIAGTDSDISVAALANELLKVAITKLGARKQKQPITLPTESIAVLYGIVQKLKADISRKYSMDEAIANTPITRSQLRWWFPKVFGVSLSRYMEEYRMMKAVEIMAANRQYTLDHVAKSLGYKHQSAFTRAFKSFYNVIPNKYFT